MKKTSVVVLICLASANTVFGMTADVESAIRNGAVGKYIYRVVDDKGVPVSNASAHVWFRSYGRPQDKANWVLKTDTNGVFSVEHRFNEKFSVGIDKEGYYHSHDEINYLSMMELPVKDGKWQPYGEIRTVVLKKIKNPHGMKIFDEQNHRRDIPVWGRWVGFDLERSDWMPPFGAGHFEDVLLRFKADVRKHRVDFTYAMEVSFTNNPYAGAYAAKKDNSSDLKTEYVANTNANFQSYFLFTTDSTADKPVHLGYVDQDDYLVFRTRTRIDDEGRLIGAHYGKICGIWRSTQKEMLMSDGCFNPVENDANIEGDQQLLYAIRNYKNAK